MQREAKGAVPILSMVVARNWRRYLLLYSTKDAALQKIMLKEIATTNWSSVMIEKERKQGTVLEICNYRSLRDGLR